jgi:hypothetical protein
MAVPAPAMSAAAETPPEMLAAARSASPTLAMSMKVHGFLR